MPTRRTRVADQLTVFTARRIMTMEPAWPEATAVAVRGDRIVSVGRTLEDLRPWLDAHPHTVDDRFRDKVLMPGLVEAHLHPLLAAAHFPATFVTPDPWTFPGGVVGDVPDGPAMLEVIRARHEELDSDEWLFVFGYAKASHAEVTRDQLDAISAERPIAVASRSSHVMVVNSATLAAVDLTADDVAESGFGEFVDFDAGYFAEDGQYALLMPRLRRTMMAPDRMRGGLELLRDMLHANGVTTVHEPGSGIFSGGRPQHEVDMIGPVFDRPDVPFRTRLTPGAVPVIARMGGIDAAIEEIEGFPSMDGDRVRFCPKKVKFFADGSYVDQIGVWREPGYIDGHHGQWMVPPENLRAWCRGFWHAGFDVHVHTMGDGGADLAVDILRDLQDERPRFDHGFTLEHLNGATPETIRRAARLGASVSALIWPLRSVGEQFARSVLGVDRLHQAFPLRTVVDSGMPLAIHADTIVSPPQPLLLAWMAVNRRSPSDEVLGEHERLTVDQALRAVTIDAARILRMEDDVGSIRAGKKADFTVLEGDPDADGGAGLDRLPVWGTVFEGTPHPSPTAR